MDDLLFFHEVQCVKDLYSKTSHETETHTFKVIDFQILIQVVMKELEDQTKMASECESLLEPHDVLFVIWVFVSKLLKYINFDFRLVFEFGVLLDDLDGDELFLLMIEALDCFTERPFS